MSFTCITCKTSTSSLAEVNRNIELFQNHLSYCGRLNVRDVVSDGIHEILWIVGLKGGSCFTLWGVKGTVVTQIS